MEKNLTLEEASIDQLKAAVYDELAKIEQAQKNIQILNQELVKRSSKLNEGQNLIETGSINAD